MTGEKMKFILMMMFVLPNAHAVDFGKYIKSMKAEVNRLLGKGEPNKEDFALPKLPKISKNALDTKVYNKSGNIHIQGASFRKLGPELKQKYWISFVEGMYLEVRGSVVQTGELTSAVNMLEQGATREGIYRSLVLSDDYRTLESMDLVPSDDIVLWSLAYSEKYLGLLFKKGDIRQLNMYGIKRVLVEKTLDLVDSFPTDGEDLYKWYAHLSVELSKKPKIAFKSKARKRTELSYHYNWAKKAPLQHIKSEIIIKVHKSFNVLSDN